MDGIFFPARILLKLDGTGSGPTVLNKKAHVIALAPSYPIGEKLLGILADIHLTGRGLNKTAVKLGDEMVAQRDAFVEDYFKQSLPRVATLPNTPIDLACVSVDGGRMQTREEGKGTGVHNPHYRENKNALISRMKSKVFDFDPHPELPRCFADRKQMKDLLPGLAEEIETEATADKEAGAAKEGAAEETPAAQIVAENVEQELRDDSWRPERLFRTCLSSLQNSDAFGRMMEAEADSRGFFRAQKRAFVSDGLAYNWTIQERHFPTFTQVLDFIHGAERIFDASRCLNPDKKLRWQEYVRWAQLVWSGRVREVIAELKQRQSEVGLPPEGCEKTDVRKRYADAIGYLTNNASRMNYPQYRKDGLPVTSALMESLVKEVNFRVKGSNQFWNDGSSGEGILEIRAGALSEDDRLVKFVHNRPGNPFHPNVRWKPELATVS